MTTTTISETDFRTLCEAAWSAAEVEMSQPSSLLSADSRQVDFLYHLKKLVFDRLHVEGEADPVQWNADRSFSAGYEQRIREILTERMYPAFDPFVLLRRYMQQARDKCSDSDARSTQKKRRQRTIGKRRNGRRR